MNDFGGFEKKPTFLELLDRLTVENLAMVEHDGVKKPMKKPGLLQQLRQAVFEGMEQTGGSSAFGSKPPLDAAAIDLLNEITEQATEVLVAVSHQPVPYGHAEDYVRLWAGQTTEHQIFTVSSKAPIPNFEYDKTNPKRPSVFAERRQADSYALVAGWTERVEDFFNPPGSREIVAPCPSCDAEHVYRMKDGHQIRIAALNFIRDRVTGETVEAKCSNCLASWDPSLFDWLARAIGASMLLDDLMAQYQDGDEHGWDLEFEWLEKKHAKKIADLVADIRVNGILKPILLGDDGRVWDGHHRIFAAHIIGLTNVPIKHAVAVRKSDTPKTA